MATPGDADLFASSDSELDITLEEEVEQEGAYRMVEGKRLNSSRLWLSGDYLYIFERENKKIWSPGGLQPATHLKCRKYSVGSVSCGARAEVNEFDKLVLKPGFSHTCGGGGKAEAEILEMGSKIKKAQLENPR